MRRTLPTLVESYWREGFVFKRLYPPNTTSRKEHDLLIRPRSRHPSLDGISYDRAAFPNRRGFCELYDWLDGNSSGIGATQQQAKCGQSGSAEANPEASLVSCVHENR